MSYKVWYYLVLMQERVLVYQMVKQQLNNSDWIISALVDALEFYWHLSFSVSYTHLRAHETEADLVCRLLLEKNFFNDTATTEIYTLHIVGSVRCV